MKHQKYLLTLILLALALSEVSAQTNWYWQNPQPQGRNLTDGKFLNPSTGFAVGYKGTIIKTINGGSNWSVIYSDTGIYFNCFEFSDSNTVFAGARLGVIFKSTDLGMNWSSMTTAINNVYDIEFVNEYTGYAVGNKILKTTDAGNSWVQQFQTGLNQIFYAVSFSDENNGIAVGQSSGYGFICKTVNGGVNWITQTNQLFSGCEDVFCLDSNIAYIAQYQSIYKTTNGGSNWNQSYSYSHASYYSLYFTSHETGFAVGEDALVSRTFDGGDNWYSNYISSISASGNTNFSRSIYFVDSLNGIITGEYGLIFQTTNGGSNWFNQKESINHFYGVHFINENTGYVCGQNGMIMKTINGGSDWNMLNSGFNGDLNDIWFVNSNEGVAVGDSCIALRTTDGGVSWTRGFTPGAYELNSVAFLNSNFGLAGGYTGHIIRTTNGGFSWSQVYYVQDGNPFEVSIPSADTMYAAGKKVLLKSTNSGINWTTLANGTSTTGFSKLQFFNSTTGYVTGTRQVSIFTNYRLLKTTNGGLSFDSISHDQIEISFSNENNGLGLFYNGSVKRTTDGGIKWIPFDLNGIDNTLNGVFAADDNKGFIIGEFGAIIQTGDIITHISNSENHLDKSFLLYQNYPNPFNPVTHLEFGILNLGFVSLKVYNVLGNEVATLVNERKNAGKYDVVFDGSDHPSGVYLYRLEIDGNVMETKRMVLLK